MSQKKSKKNKKGKEIRFDLFRYQIIPKTNAQISLFNKSYSTEELKSNKNVFLRQALFETTSFFSSSGDVLAHALSDGKENTIVMRIGPKKIVELSDKDFNLVPNEDHPSVYVFINNDPDKQVIAISSNNNAFSSPFVVANILEQNINRTLDYYSLEVAIGPILNSNDFWELVKKYENRITSLRFKIGRPNISEITKTIGEDIKNIITDTNSANAKLELNAPKGRTLENINEGNQELQSLTEPSIQGVVEITIKADGVLRPITTYSTTKKLFISEFTVESQNGDISELLKGLI